MLHKAIAKTAAEIETEAGRELKGLGGLALRSTGLAAAAPSPVPGSGGAAQGMVASQGDNAEEHAASLRKAAVPVPDAGQHPPAVKVVRDAEARRSGGGPTSASGGQDGRSVWADEPASGRRAQPRRPQPEQAAPRQQHHARQEPTSAAGDSGAALGRRQAMSAVGAPTTGDFAGAPRGRPLAKCSQIPTDGTVRLAPRARSLYKHLAPRNRWAEVAASTPADCPQRPGRDFSKHPLTIHIPTQSTKSPDGRFDCAAGKIDRCPFDCVVTNTRAATADVVLSVTPGASVRAQGHCPLQKTAHFSMETEVYYPSLAITPESMRSWDFIGTTKLASDVPLGYGGWFDFNLFEPPVPKTADAIAVAVISNCAGHNRRLEYIRELVRAGVTVHHLGACDHNKDWSPPSGMSRGRFVDKIDMLRPYKFTLAFENTNDPDYVTEKYFQPLVAGSVPVYMGAQNSELYAPAPHSVIRTDDFADARALAKYLLFLASNEEAYNALLEWKYTGVSPGFAHAMAATTDMHSHCRLCRLARETLEVEVGDRDALSPETVLAPQTKDEAPGAVPYPGMGG